MTREGATVSSSWRFYLERLRDEFVIAFKGLPECYHGIIMVDGELPSDIERVVPRFYAAMGNELVHRIVIPFPSGGYHLHFFFTDFYDNHDRRGLDALQERLHNIHTLLAKLPARVLPTIVVPPRENGLEENIVRWMYGLHWLASTPGHSIFKTEREFLYCKGDFAASESLHPWAECSTVPDFDPCPLMTGTGSPTKNLGYWKRQHNEAGKRFPEVIASSLTKPLLYASVNAIGLLLNRESPPLETGSVKKRVCRTPKDGRLELERDHVAVLDVLKKRHAYGLEDRLAPLTHDQILDEIKLVWAPPDANHPEYWCRSRIQRTIVDLFGNAKRYKAMCRAGKIIAFIQEREFPTPRHESPSEDLNWVEDCY